jgi:hypothetical protein
MSKFLKAGMVDGVFVRQTNYNRKSPRNNPYKPYSPDNESIEYHDGERTTKKGSSVLYLSQSQMEELGYRDGERVGEVKIVLQSSPR